MILIVDFTILLSSPVSSPALRQGKKITGVYSSVLLAVALNDVVLLEPADCGFQIAECGLEDQKKFAIRDLQSETRNRDDSTVLELLESATD